MKYICQYCTHSEAYKTALYCHQHQATVERDDTCPVFEREPGSDDDLDELTDQAQDFDMGY